LSISLHPTGKRPERDLERAHAFYRDALGLDSPGVTGTEFAADETNAAGAVVMFRLDGGKDTPTPASTPNGSNEHRLAAGVSHGRSR
jgi:catechol 2,3-dioxygenase-like lactoylglutathione lyase family enzyme